MSDIPSIAPLRNVAALHTLVERLINRGAETGADLPGMATFYGPSGDGKSTAGIYVRNRFDAVLVQCKSTWTKASLCRAILTEMGLPPTGTIDAMAERITEALAISDRCLIVDEADFLVQRRMIEVLRDIYEGSKAPVILIGEEGMPQKLRAWERIHNRMLDWVATQPAEMADVRHLAKIYAPGIEIDEAMAKRVLDESRLSIRRICVNLDSILQFARLQGLDRVTVEAWGRRSLFTGEAPEPRGRIARRAGARA